MRRRVRKRSGDDEIPVASFSDIAFLLIIFFILVTTLQKDLGFQAEIPAGEKSSENTADEAPSVTLRDDRYMWKDEFITREQLEKNLAELKLAEKEKEQDKIVLMEAVGSVNWQSYFELMSMIRAHGGVIAIVKEDKDSE